MSYMRNLILKLRRGGEEGATAVEYGIMVALIAAVIVAIVLLLGRQVRAGFCNTSEALAEGNAYTDGSHEVAGPDTECTDA